MTYVRVTVETWKEVVGLTTLNQMCTSLEGILNRIGYIPFLGTLSAFVRSAMGTLQIALGVVCFAASAILVLCFALADVWWARVKWGERMKNSAHHIVQGFLNLGRAVIEKVPFLPLVTTLPYDLMGFSLLRYR